MTPTPSIIRRCAAEALGTFLLVFVGSGAAANAAFRFRTTPAVGVMLVALGLGLALFAGISIAGKVSGGHYNPAVTVGLAAARHFAWADVPGYLVGQVVGAVIGALAILLVFGTAGAQVAGLGAPSLAPDVSIGQGLLIEGLGTAILVLAIMATAVDTRAAAGWAPLTIGLTLTSLILLLGSTTGGSVNPARAFGPDLVATFFGYPVNWVAFVVSYLIGPLLGGVLGAFAYATLAALPRPPATTRVGGRRPQAGEAPHPDEDMGYTERGGLPAT